MNRFTITLAALAMGVSAFAQNAAEPNRIFVTDVIGNSQGYVLDRVSDLNFARVEGEVKAVVEFKELVSLEELKVAVTRTPDCVSYVLAVLPSNVARQFSSPLMAINYVNRTPQSRYYEDFTNASLTGIRLSGDSEYTILTVGYDTYGVADGVSTAEFKTPAPEIEGDPQVTCTVDEVTLDSFTCTFTPNDDVAAYYYVAGEKGTMQQQYEMFGPAFGFSNFTQMLMAWSIQKLEESTYTWTRMSPNTEYEIYVVSLDINGNPAPYQVFDVSTLSLGGSGVAEVAIELGEYTLSDWNGEMKPSQFITYTPNDQASCFRVGVYKADIYDSDTEAIKQELCQDPPMPMAYWFFYETLTTDYQIDPGTEAVAIAAAKNSNGEWGPVNELRFTTPAETPGGRSTIAPAGNGKVVPRMQPKAILNAVKAGYAPEFKPAGIILK